ncbi:MAG: hypothetical protein JXR88_09735 [Clostridia bacterium]|nr:hypothetical protein [Clostridia bacterium]
MGAEARKKIQKALLERNEEVSLKESHIPIEILKALDENHPLVKKTLKGGLTAYVYKFEYEGKNYCLKKKREHIKVQNDDGQLSFLNEILCRKHIEKYRENPLIDKGVSKTYYASLKEGLILTEWIEGEHPTTFNRTRIKHTFKLLNALESIGLFEWDLCSGNLLYREDQLIVFDFGYMYQMDPLKGVNSEKMNAPVFHMVERFETRAYMGYLLNYIHQRDELMNLYRILKEEAVIAYEEKIVYLKSHFASNEIIEFYEAYKQLWNAHLVNDEALYALFLEDGYRSYALDVHDDLTGQTCTKGTLKKIDYLLETLKTSYDDLNMQSKLLWFDEMSKADLLSTYELRKENAKKWQV